MEELQQFTDYVYRYPNCHSCEDILQVLKIEVYRCDEKELEFDLIGLRPYVVNAIRQTILNDVPTMAIEEVYFHKNTSIFNCDYISQRLSLVPIRADPENFKFVYNSDMSQLNSDSTIVFNLNECNNRTEVMKVYTSSLVWEPIGEKQKSLSKIESLFPNIPLLQLKPSEEISCRIFCIKGLGRNHMKFCPGFAHYCFLSKIEIDQDKFTTPSMALALQRSFPPGVIDLKMISKNTIKPYVANERLDRHSRSFKNEEGFEKNINVKYYRDHIIFSVESYGVIHPNKMVSNALAILSYKYNAWKRVIEQAKNKISVTS